MSSDLDGLMLPEMRNRMRRTLARNPNSRAEQLSALALSPDWETRCSVASNPGTMLRTLRMLALDDNFTVRDHAEKALTRRGRRL